MSRSALASVGLSNIHPGYAAAIVMVIVPTAHVIGGSFVSHLVPSEFTAVYLTTVALAVAVFFGCALLFDLEG
jgi:hypothetical protein